MDSQKLLLSNLFVTNEVWHAHTAVSHSYNSIILLYPSNPDSGGLKPQCTNPYFLSSIMGIWIAEKQLHLGQLSRIISSPQLVQHIF